MKSVNHHSTIYCVQGDDPITEECPIADVVGCLARGGIEEIIQTIEQAPLDEVDDENHDLYNVVTLLGGMEHVRRVFARYEAKYNGDQRRFEEYLLKRREKIVTSMRSSHRKACVSHLFERIVALNLGHHLIYQFAVTMADHNLFKNLALFNCTVSYLNSKDRGRFFLGCGRAVARHFFDFGTPEDFKKIISALTYKKIDILPEEFPKSLSFTEEQA